MVETDEPVYTAYEYFAIGHYLRDRQSSTELRTLREKLEKPVRDGFDKRVEERLARYSEEWDRYRQAKARRGTSR